MDIIITYSIIILNIIGLAYTDRNPKVQVFFKIILFLNGILILNFAPSNQKLWTQR